MKTAAGGVAGGGGARIGPSEIIPVELAARGRGNRDDGRGQVAQQLVAVVGVHSGWTKTPARVIVNAPAPGGVYECWPPPSAGGVVRPTYVSIRGPAMRRATAVLALALLAPAPLLAQRR